MRQRKTKAESALGKATVLFNRRHEHVVEHLRVVEVHPYEKSARRRDAATKRALRQNIASFGLLTPLLVDEYNVLIAGEGRLEAAVALGHETVPVIRIRHLTPAEIRAYRIADNRLVERGSWDFQALKLEFTELLDLGFDDIELSGFEVGEIDAIVLDETIAGGLGAEDRYHVATGPAVARVGDDWLLDQHRIRCGDARDPGAYQALMCGDHADVLFADPPYNVKIDGHVSGLGKQTHREFGMASGEMTEAQFGQFLQDTLAAASATLKDGALSYVFMDWRSQPMLAYVLRKVVGEAVNCCIWVKDSPGMGSLYRSQHELVLVNRRGAAPHRNNVQLGRHGRNRSNVWNYPGVNGFGADKAAERALHPTPKPVALVADAILDCTAPNDIVLDNFLGAGATIMACEQTGRRGRGLELDPLYVDTVIRRWQAATGKAAVLASSGQSFDDRAAAVRDLGRLVPPSGTVKRR